MTQSTRHWAVVLGVTLVGGCSAGMPDNSASEIRTRRGDMAQPVDLAHAVDMAQAGGSVDMAQAGSGGSADMATGGGSVAARHITGQVYHYVGGVRTSVGSGVNVYAYVFLSNGSGHTLGGTATDANGHYDIANAVDGFYVLYALVPSSVQPCMHAVTIANGDGVANDIEVVSTADLTAGVQPHDIYGTTLSGIATKDGVATAGMDIEVEYLPDLVTAWTYAGPGGQYSICGLTNTTFGGYASYQGTIEQDFVVTVSGNTMKNVGN